VTAVPTRTPPPWRRVLTGLLATGCCVTTAGCFPGSGGSDEQESVGPPEVGQCYDTPDSVLPDAHDTTAPTPCARPHTLETYDVLQADSPLDQEAIAAMGQRCAAAVDEFLGGDFQHTAVSIYYFAPTNRQQEQGARWVRCDVGVVTDTAVSGTRPVTGSLRGVFADGVPVEYRRCLNAPPSPGRRQRLVSCLQPHVAQQLPAGVELGGLGKRYPGVPRLTGDAQPRCAEAVRQVLPGADRSLVVVPTPAMWRGGATTAQCWALAAPGERLNDSEAQPA
jgi:hypothetical protein